MYWTVKEEEYEYTDYAGVQFAGTVLCKFVSLFFNQETQINYEDQISKIVVEKQELEWQKVTFLHGFCVLTAGI